MKFFDTTNPFEKADPILQQSKHFWLPFCQLLTKYEISIPELNGLLTEIDGSAQFQERLQKIDIQKEECTSQSRLDAISKASYYDLLYKMADEILLEAKIMNIIRDEDCEEIQAIFANKQ